MEKHKSRTSFLKNTAFATISQGLAFLTAAIIGVITARYLGAEGKGQIALVTSTGMVLAQMLCLGFDQAGQYYVASGKLASEKVFGAWIITFFIGTLITFGIVYPLLLAYCMDNLFKGVPGNLLLLAGLTCPLYMLRLLINSILRGKGEFPKAAYHDMTIYSANIAASVLALVVLGYGIWGFISMSMALGFTSLAVGFVILGKVISLRPVFSLSSWLQVFYYGAKTILSKIFTLIDLRLDIYIVSFFMGPSFVGIYSIAGALANGFWLLTNSIAEVLFSRVASDDMEESRKLTGLLCRNVLWLTAILGVLFLMISKRLIVFMYTGSFAGAALALAFLMPGVVGQAVSRICFTDVSARGFPEKATYSAAITAILTIAFDLYLIPVYGINGAAVASSIAYCTSGILGLYWHLILSGNNLAALIIPQKTDLRYYLAVYKIIKARFAS